MNDAMQNVAFLAFVHGAELDDMQLRQDYVCGGCRLANDTHRAWCPVRALLEARRRMVPMIVGM